MYLANNIKPIRSDYINPDKIYQHIRQETLVTIIAYCLMPNHFHIFLKEKIVGNKTIFLRKLCTGYSMYYNKKYSHSGTLFQGPAKAKLVDSDDYYNYLIQYIHLNPFSIDKQDILHMPKIEYLQKAIDYSRKYEYSSYRDYLGENRAQSVILKP